MAASTRSIAFLCALALCRSMASGCVPADTAAEDVAKLPVALADSAHREPAAVAIEGDRLAVGLCHARVSGSSGHVDVYRLRNGVWVLDQSILSDDRTSGSPFGSGVSMDGGLCAIGAPGAAIGKTGSVIVLKDDGKQYLEVARLQPHVDRIIPTFGSHLALTADYCAVTAPTDRGRGTEKRSGTVFVYKRTDAGWLEDGEIRAPPDFDTMMFGVGLAIDGHTLVVAAEGVRVDQALKASPVFVYQRTDGAWVHEATLDQQPMNAGIGPISRPVSVDGGRIAIGGRSETPGFCVGIYEHRDGSWVETTVVTREGERPFDFATTLLLRGDSLVVGRGGWKGGSLYTYRWDNVSTEWKMAQQFNSDYADSWFAIRVASDGKHVVAAESRNEPHLAILHIAPLNQGD